MQSDDASDGTGTVEPGPGVSTLPGRLAIDVPRYLTSPLAPGLYLVATPIGNLADITLRALTTLARADVIYCEDTRHSRTLIAHFGIGRPLRPYHEHNAEEQRPRILADLGRGGRIALISDAGTPLVSDPGYKLVRDCIAEGHPVVAVPGASAVMAAISVAGLPTDTFLFAGFLPPRSGARQSRITELAATPATLVFFEAPTRVADTLADLSATLGNRPAAVARELTKLHETVERGSLADLAERFTAAPQKGEMVIVVGPPTSEAVTDEGIAAALSEALAHMSLRDAAKAVADRLSVPKARVYDLGLKLKADRSA
jgi:16S rRNA (cytidine1402-2'-O)-methyltransferase